MRKSFPQSILWLNLIIIYTGCTATIGYLNEGMEKYPTTEINSVKFYSSRHINQEVIEIGYVAVHNMQQPKGDFLKEELRKKAAELGADAVIGFQLFGFTAEGIAVKYK
jgi:hypothetical protein